MNAVDLDSLTRWIREFARVVGAEKQRLTDLDAAIGDADHGINMDRGMTAVLAALDASPLDAAGLAKALRAGLDGVVQRGKAEACDKTMFDALAPAADALDEAVAAGAGLADTLSR